MRKLFLSLVSCACALHVAAGWAMEAPAANIDDAAKQRVREQLWQLARDNKISFGYLLDLARLVQGQSPMSSRMHSDNFCLARRGHSERQWIKNVLVGQGFLKNAPNEGLTKAELSSWRLDPACLAVIADVEKEFFNRGSCDPRLRPAPGLRGASEKDVLNIVVTPQEAHDRLWTLAHEQPWVFQVLCKHAHYIVEHPEYFRNDRDPRCDKHYMFRFEYNTEDWLVSSGIVYRITEPWQFKLSNGYDMGIDGLRYNIVPAYMAVIFDVEKEFQREQNAA